MLGCANTGPAGPQAAAPADEPAAAATLPEPLVVGSKEEYHDPLIGWNRAVFRFNHLAYRYGMIPLGRAYLWLTPDPVEPLVGNFFRNLKSPIDIVNSLLQLRPRESGVSLARLLINSTAGLLGFFDVAAHWGLEPAPAGFADTLARYGAGPGPYLVLPLLGASSLREAPSEVVDYLLHPVPYLLEQPASTAVMGFDRVQEFSPQADRYLQLYERSQDPYLFFRNLHLQGLERDARYPE